MSCSQLPTEENTLTLGAPFFEVFNGMHHSLTHTPTVETFSGKGALGSRSTDNSVVLPLP